MPTGIYIRTNETKEKTRQSLLGHFVSEESKEKNRQSNLGKKYSNRKKPPPFTEEHREKMRQANSGEKNNNWKNGITPENLQIRQSIEYRLWREAVFARDNWTCQKYGIKGGKLRVHHIHNFADYPELRFAIDNGITFLDKAHREFHKIYGRKNNTEEQLLKFLKRNH